MELRPINEQVVVIAGASSGIGRAAALKLAGEGAKMVVSARSEPGLDSLVAEIRAAGGEATAIPADVADAAQVRALADRAAETYGRIDTWVHASAVLLHALFEDTTPEEFERVIQVNLLGQVYGAMAALPHLRREGRGSLIHISSVEARRALPYHSAYAASKHGVDGFVEAMRVELRKEGLPINVVQIMPATINTPLFTKARTKTGVKPVGAPPLYQPGTVADLVLYAAEHHARDLISGGVGANLLQMQRMSPRLMDALLLRAGFRAQRTNEAKSADAPDNLYGPLPAYDRVEGDFGKMAFRRSLFNWLETHPTARRAAILATLVGAGAAVSGRANGSGS